MDIDQRSFGKIMYKKITNFIFNIVFLSSIYSCKTASVSIDVVRDGVQLPYIKNTANECYFLDEFMPIPDNLVAGRSGKLQLRYYTYKLAHYKDFKDKHIILSFYSTDEQCWSLFEEYYVAQ